MLCLISVLSIHDWHTVCVCPIELLQMVWSVNFALYCFYIDPSGVNDLSSYHVHNVILKWNGPFHFMEHCFWRPLCSWPLQVSSNMWINSPNYWFLSNRLLTIDPCRRYIWHKPQNNTTIRQANWSEHRNVILLPSSLLTPFFWGDIYVLKLLNRIDMFFFPVCKIHCLDL